MLKITLLPLSLCPISSRLFKLAFRTQNKQTTSIRLILMFRVRATQFGSRFYSENALLDSFGRFHSYLRISLTEKCNLRCTYCMPEEGVPLNPSHKLLTKSEIVRLTRLFAHHGVDKVRLTGGEPTIRPDLVEIVRGIRSIDSISNIGITSNGIALERKLDDLIDAGLNRLNLSLDTLDSNKYCIMTRRNGFGKVMSCIEKARSKLPMVKLNCVVIRGVNDDEVVDFVRLTEQKNIDVRFIEYMPFGGNKFEAKKMVPYKELMTRIGQCFENRIIRLKDKPNDTSKAYKVVGFRGQFGFITSMSTPFCGTCNRVRITADGNLKVCLHGEAEVSLRDRLRAGDSDQEVIGVVREALLRKKKQHAGMDVLSHGRNRPMILIGGLTNFTSRRYYSQLSHLDSEGRAAMVDVTGKSDTFREAEAEAIVTVRHDVMLALRENKLKKGDVLTTAKLAGIMAAKRTPDLIPLCHHINLTHVMLDLHLQESSVLIRARTRTRSGTGVEMEALTAASVAALTVYDMVKALGPAGLAIGPIRLLRKSGGRTHYKAPS